VTASAVPWYRFPEARPERQGKTDRLWLRNLWRSGR